MVRIIAVTFILGGFRNINTVVLKKNLDFKRLTYVEQVTSILHTLIVIALAYQLRTVWALVYGQIAASLIGLVMSFTIIPGRPRLLLNKSIARELFAYGKFITGSSVVLFIAMEMDKIVAGKILGVEILGYYVLAFSLANLPAKNISRVISDVLFPAYAKLQENLSALQDAYLMVLKYVSLLTLPAAAGIIALAPEIIRVLYGEKWLPALDPLWVLCVFGGIRSITSLNGYLFNGIGKPKIQFYIISFRLCLIALIIWPLTREYGLAGTAIAVTIPLAVQLILGLYFITRYLQLSAFPVIRALSVSIGSSLIMALVVVYTKSLIGQVNIFTLLLLTLTGIITHAIINLRNILDIYHRRRIVLGHE
jgi:PST family polysaccharide transporter/lipopolysaccharide exporter